MTENPSKDRRNTVRTELILKVEYAQPQNLITDYLTNLSDGGLFIRTNASFEIGQRIAFTISFPGLLDPMPLEGVVRWRRELPGQTMDEDPGIGVEFLFRSQQERDVVDNLIAGAKDAEESNPKPDAGGRPFRVLLVEDNQFVHDLFRHAVKKLHRGLDDPGVLEIVSTFNGHEALRVLEDREVDLAIVDHFLPVMSGSDLIIQMRNDPKLRDIPILVVSIGGDDVRDETMKAGADLFLDKPVLLKQLLTTLHLLLREKGLTSRE